MTTLTVTGTPFPDPLSFQYTRATAIKPSSVPSDSAYSGAAVQYSYKPSHKSSYTITTREIPPPIPSKAHHHTRSISSVILPPTVAASQPLPVRSRPSNSTSHSRQSSTTSTFTTNMNMNMSMQRQSTSASTAGSYAPRRSTSARSTATNSPTSYVALMRRQKATVWCDRAQNVDPRSAAQEKAARARANLVVQSAASAVSGGRTSTINSGSMVGKIRHGGIPKAPGYVPANLSGAGVPMRLSANEMLGDEEESGSMITGDNSMVHGRSGSGKSSTHSAQYRSGYPRPDAGRFSSNSTPPSGEGSPGGPQQRIPEHADEHSEYFGSQLKQHSADEDSFGELKDMTGPNSAKQAVDSAKSKEDLRRRGSVDERAMSMGAGVKLFVANPDLDDD